MGKSKKVWQKLDESSLKRVSGQLGVFELGNKAGEVVYIGVADAHSLFGLHGELVMKIGSVENFRCEVTTAYSTRLQELLMQHCCEAWSIPLLKCIGSETLSLGRISP